MRLRLLPLLLLLGCPPAPEAPDLQPAQDLDRNACGQDSDCYPPPGRKCVGGYCVYPAR